MGSLMAGWDSRVHDPKAVTYERNRSFTKEEIDAYWRTKKKIEEEHLKAISGSVHSSSQQQQESTLKEESESAGLKQLQRSSSLPLADTKERVMENISETDTSSEKLLLKNGWWTSSNSAHLNEPPVIGGPEGGSHKYAAQFHVAGFSAAKPNPAAGITA